MPQDPLESYAWMRYQDNVTNYITNLAIKNDEKIEMCWLFAVRLLPPPNSSSHSRAAWTRNPPTAEKVKSIHTLNPQLTCKIRVQKVDDVKSNHTKIRNGSIAPLDTEFLCYVCLQASIEEHYNADIKIHPKRVDKLA